MRHEETHIYQKCLELMRVAQALIEHLPKGFGFLADQVRRNTASVAHNVAEGYYQSSPGQHRRFVDYALQSAREASSSFDTALCFKAATPEMTDKGKGLALELVKMLSKFRR